MMIMHDLTTARHLKQVVSLKLLEHGALQLDKVVGDQDGEKGLAVGVDCHVE